MEVFNFGFCCGDSQRRRGKDVDKWTDYPVREKQEENHTEQDDSARSEIASVSSTVKANEISRLEEKAADFENHSLLQKRLEEKANEVETQLDQVNVKTVSLHNQIQSLDMREKELRGELDSQMDDQDSDSDKSGATEMDSNPSFKPEETIEASTEVGVACFARKDYALAQLHFLQARHIARSQGDEKAEARAEGNLSNVFSSMGQPKRALVHFKRALRLLRKLKETVLEGFILSNGVICCIQMKKYDEALGLALRKLAISKEPADKAEAEMWIERINQVINDELDMSFNAEQVEEKSGDVDSLETPTPNKKAPSHKNTPIGLQY